MGQKYVQADANGIINAFYDADVNSPAQIGTALAITDAQWQDASSNQDKYKIVAGALSLVPPPTAAQVAAQQLSAAWAAYQGQARAALDKSDITMVRCTENAVAVPATWATYRAALRAIISAATGDPTRPLPTRPAYPAGT